MSEEAAFLEALTKDPLDDVTRAVYADWLEERGDPRAAFLRAEIELSKWPDEAPGWIEAAAAVPRDGNEEVWEHAVGPRYDVWLMGYDVTRKLACIKTIRELTGLGLRESKDLSEALPARVVGALPSGPALRVVAALFQADRLGSVVVRRAGSPVPDLQPGWPKLIPPPPPGPLSLWLVTYPPVNRIHLIRILRENSRRGLAECKALVERPLPVCLHDRVCSNEADVLRAAYAPWATVEVTPAGIAGPAPAS